MQIFELYFNPNAREDHLFSSTIHNPKAVVEKRFGGLYMIGELQHAFPVNNRLLTKLAQQIQTKYYTFTLKTPERALTESLKKANDYLSEEIKKNNVSWLGNLRFAALALKDYHLYFTNTGDLKILLLRGSEIIDIAKDLNQQEIEPYPLKVFFNVVSGKLAENDSIVVLTAEVFEFFKQYDILTSLAHIALLDEKKLQTVLRPELLQKKDGLKVSGICLLISLTSGPAPYRKPKEIKYERQDEFSFSQIFSFLPAFQQKITRLFLFLKKPSLLWKKTARIFKKTTYSFWKSLQLLPKKRSEKKLARKLPSTSFIPKKLILVFGFTLFLFAGFLIFQKGNQMKADTLKKSIDQIQETVSKAEGYLTLQNKDQARTLLKESWKNIVQLNDPRKNTDERIQNLQKKIEAKLKEIYNFQTLENPAVFFDFSKETTSLDLRKIVFTGSALTLFAPGASTIEKLSFTDHQLTTALAPNNIRLAASWQNMFWVQTDQNSISRLDEKNQWETFALKNLKDNSRFTQIAIYAGNLYGLDPANCQIVKYPDLSLENPQLWQKTKFPPNDCNWGEVMALDSSIWILKKDDSFDMYRNGSFTKTFAIDLFPSAGRFDKIETQLALPYLYLMDIGGRRIIITDKTGVVIKQITSDKFDDLRDFTVSPDGKTIWILNKSTIYQVAS